MDHKQDFGLFGTSGIRGKLGKTFSPELAHRLGLTAGSFFHTDTILIGADYRPQARLLRQSLVRGLIETGMNVINVGKLPTSALLVGCRLFDAPGIMLTGSHTPPEIIGTLFFKSDTSELVSREEEQFEQILVERDFKTVNYQNIGKVERQDISTEYIDYILSQVTLSHVEGKEIVVDPGNGSASGFLSTGLAQAGVNTIAFNNFPDPTFPNRSPSPRPDNLKKLGKLAKANNSIGIATDGDGDRALFADEAGNILWGDRSGAIFAADAVKRYNTKKVVVTVNSSSVIKWAVESSGGDVIDSAIGPPEIIATMKKEETPFGVEESGKNIWSEPLFYGDALLSALRMLEILERTGSSLRELVAQLPSFHMKKIAIDCPEQLKEKVLELSFKKWQEREENAEIVSIDGKKIIYDDSWLLLRPSGTEPVFRVFSEAKSEEKADKLLKKGKNLVEHALEEVG